MLFDHPPETFDRATTFWAAALGMEAKPEPEPNSEFTELGVAAGLEVATQRLGEGPARVHADIETDDIAAEVERLTALGAAVTRSREGCVIMADPGGVPFCVVGIQTGEHFEREATTWP